MKWSAAGFEPASSACKADVLPNELRPQSCRDRNRTDIKRHVTTQLSLSATLQYLNRDRRTRTADFLRVMQMLSQLNYVPMIRSNPHKFMPRQLRAQESNLLSSVYEAEMVLPFHSPAKPIL